MQMVLQESYNAFMETKSAFVLLKDLLEMSQEYDRRLSAMSPSEFEAERARALSEIDNSTVP